MPKYLENTRKYAAGGVLIFVLCVLAIAPVSAQSGDVPTATPERAFVTPTPLPGPVATANAAAQIKDSAQADLNTAAQLRAQAAEIERNAAIQKQQADQAMADARAAAAAQNAAAFGEAIGRAESAIDQQQRSAAGQAVIIATLTARTEAQASTIISLTNEAQALRVDKQTIGAAYTALSKQQDEHKSDGAIGNIVVLFIFVVALVIFVALIWYVIQIRRGRFTIEPAAQQIPDAEPPVEGEFQTIPNDQSEGTL